MGRFRTLLTLGTVVICGHLLGAGVAPLLANELFSPAPQVTRWLSLPDLGAPDEDAEWFDPSRLEGPRHEIERPEVPERHDEAPACGGPLRLIGVAHDRGQPERSVALLRDGAAASATRVDEEFGDWTLVSTAPSRALLRRASDGSTCGLSLFETAPKAPEARPHAPHETAAAAGVRALGPGRFSVDRRQAETLLTANPYRMLPVERDGEVRAVRIFGIRAGDIASSTGLANGDTITHLDGRPLEAGPGLLEAYARLRGGESVEITVERQGESFPVRYQLH